MIPLNPTPAEIITTGMEVDGAIASAVQIIENFEFIQALLTQLQANGSSAVPGFNFGTVASASNAVLNVATVGAAIPSTFIARSGGAALSDTTDTAAHIAAALPNGGYVGQTFLTVICNLNSDTLTLVAGSGITLAGTTTIATDTIRFYLGKVTAVGTPAITLTGMFAVATATA